MNKTVENRNKEISRNNPMIRLAAVMERTRLHVDDGEFLLAYIKELERKCTSEGCIEIVEKISGIQNH